MTITEAQVRQETGFTDVDELPAEKFEQLDRFIENLETKKGSLIQVLYKAQEIFGYLPRDVQLFVARKIGVSAASVTGVVTFYSYFTTQKKGKHIINVCMGTACFVKGSEKILEKLKDKLGIDIRKTTQDGLFTLQDIRCVGTCGLAPVLMIDDKVYGHVTEDKLDEILDSYKQKA
jgi:NADH-quinone oxidoreductase subunit E/NADP-reducing hydrogenase subunit HndA